MATTKRRITLVGPVVGYTASKTMDQATGWFFARQSEESRRREEELAPGGTLVQIGKQIGRATGQDLRTKMPEKSG